MPTPIAELIILSQRQQTVLQQIASHTTNSYRLVRRAKLILAAASGENNTAISEQLQLHRRQVRQWRQRWIEAFEQLASAEEQQVSDKNLKQLKRKHFERRDASRDTTIFRGRTGSANRGSGLF